MLSGDDAAQRSVGNLEHLLNDADRADALHVVGTGILDFAIAQHDEADRLAFAQRLFDQLNAGLLYDGERNDGVRKEHRFLKRQDADQVGGHDGVVGFSGFSGIGLGVSPLYHDVEFGTCGRHVGGRRDRRDDDEHAVFVTRRDAFVFDRDRQRNPLDEVAV